MTKQKKIAIAVSVTAIVLLIFACVMFGIWAEVEVSVRYVDYATLQKRLGDYYIVPTGLDGEIDGKCRVNFPMPEEGSRHHYGKYTNLTVRYRYASGYALDVCKGELSGSICAMQKWNEELLVDHETVCINGKDIYYKQTVGDVSNFDNSQLEIIYLSDNVLYGVSARGKVGNEVNIKEYAIYLFEKVFVDR